MLMKQVWAPENGSHIEKEADSIVLNGDVVEIMCVITEQAGD